MLTGIISVRVRFSHIKLTCRAPNNGPTYGIRLKDNKFKKLDVIIRNHLKLFITYLKLLQLLKSSELVTKSRVFVYYILTGFRK